MRFDEIDIDDHILDKILLKHHVEFDEILEACTSRRRLVRRGRHGGYVVYGVTGAVATS